MGDWEKEVVIEDWSNNPDSPLYRNTEWWGYTDMSGREKNMTGHPLHRWKWFIIVQNRGGESPQDRGYFIYDTLHSTQPYYGQNWNMASIKHYFPSYSTSQLANLHQSAIRIQKKIVREHFVKKHGSYAKGVEFAEKEANKKSVYSSHFPPEESVTLYKNSSNFDGGFRTLAMAKRFCEELYDVQIMLDVSQSIINHENGLYLSDYDFANRVVGRNFNLSFEEVKR